MISQSTTLSVPNTSRYKDTPLLVDGDGNAFFGLYVVPAELTPPASVTNARLYGAEVPFLDILANRVYGTGSELQWWAIAITNGVIDLDRDVLPGGEFSAPSVSVMAEMAARQGFNNG